MRPTSKSQILNRFGAANGKRLAMIKLEMVTLLAASPSAVNERALATIAHENFSPYGSRHIPSSPL